MSRSVPEGQDIDIAVDRRSGVDIVTVQGDLDMFSHLELRRILADATVCGQAEVVLDISGVSFMDSVGLSAIVLGNRKIQARSATLSVVCPDGPSRRLLHSTGIDQVVTTYAAMTTALAAASLREAPASSKEPEVEPPVGIEPTT